MLRTSSRAASAGLLVMAVLVAGCSLPGSGPDAGDAADTLAAGLSKGSLDTVAFTGDDGDRPVVVRRDRQGCRRFRRQGVGR